jgi:IS30 family transposase
MPSPSANDLRKSKIVPFPAIGRAICCAGRATTTWPRWSSVIRASSLHVRQLPAALRRSLTWDRGLEMAQHKSFTMATDVQIYSCDPQIPWQRGSNENTNGLLRQYLPKKADLSCYSQSDLDEIALRLNQRPRKTLGFQTPADRLQASVASTP